MKPESGGGGLLFLRHVTPRARRNVVYFYSGAYSAAPATTKLTSESLPEAKPAAKTKAGAPGANKNQLVRRGPAGEAEARKSRAAASAHASAAKHAGSQPPDTCKSAKRARAAAKKSEKAPRKAEFREVLARSVRAEKPKSRQEREQRVSVRLSNSEERLLRDRAKEAGLTVSEYLRRSVLEAETSRPEEQRNQTEIPKRGSQPAAASPLFAASTPLQRRKTAWGWAGGCLCFGTGFWLRPREFRNARRRPRTELQEVQPGPCAADAPS
jgi:hypothetical protein